MTETSSETIIQRISQLESVVDAIMAKLPSLEKDIAGLATAAAPVIASPSIFTIMGEAVPIEQALTAVITDVQSVMGQIGQQGATAAVAVATKPAPAAPAAPAPGTVGS